MARERNVMREEIGVGVIGLMHGKEITAAAASERGAEGAGA